MAELDTLQTRMRDKAISQRIAMERLSTTMQQRLARRIENDIEPRLKRLLAERLANIGPSGIDPGPATTARLDRLVKEMRAIKRTAYQTLGRELESDLRDLARIERDFLANEPQKQLRALTASAITLNFASPTVEEMAAIIRIKPIKGRLLADMVSDLEAGDVRRIEAAVRAGVEAGETTATITRRIFGGGNIAKAGSEQGITRKRLKMLVRTATSNAENQVRRFMAEANDDIIVSWTFLSVLDFRTSQPCRALDGQVFKKGQNRFWPPIHPSCRSTTYNNYGDEELSRRTSVRVKKTDRQGKTPEEYRAFVKTKIGKEAPGTTYDDWFKRLKKSEQVHIMGGPKTALVRKGGLSQEDFLNRHTATPYTMKQLRRKHPGAFERAGLAS